MKKTKQFLCPTFEGKEGSDPEFQTDWVSFKNIAMFLSILFKSSIHFDIWPFLNPFLKFHDLQNDDTSLKRVGFIGSRKALVFILEVMKVRVWRSEKGQIVKLMADYKNIGENLAVCQKIPNRLQTVPPHTPPHKKKR